MADVRGDRVKVEIEADSTYTVQCIVYSVQYTINMTYSVQCIRGEV